MTATLTETERATTTENEPEHVACMKCNSVMREPVIPPGAVVVSICGIKRTAEDWDKPDSGQMCAVCLDLLGGGFCPGCGAFGFIISH